MIRFCKKKQPQARDKIENNKILEMKINELNKRFLSRTWWWKNNKK